MIDKVSVVAIDRLLLHCWLQLVAETTFIVIDWQNEKHLLNWQNDNDCKYLMIHKVKMIYLTDVIIIIVIDWWMHHITLFDQFSSFLAKDHVIEKKKFRVMIWGFLLSLVKQHFSFISDLFAFGWNENNWCIFVFLALTLITVAYKFAYQFKKCSNWRQNYSQ